jgi:hypothetical protein
LTVVLSITPHKPYRLAELGKSVTFPQNLQKDANARRRLHPSPNDGRGRRVDYKTQWGKSIRLLQGEALGRKQKIVKADQEKNSLVPR